MVGLMVLMKAGSSVDWMVEKMAGTLDCKKVDKLAEKMVDQMAEKMVDG